MEVTKYIPINWRLIKHPANWAIVFLMVVIAGFAIELIYNYINSNSGVSSNV